MRMFAEGMGPIVLVSMVLLAKIAVATEGAGAEQTPDEVDFDSLGEVSKRISIAQTRESLKSLEPDMKIGSVSARELLKMDHIGVRHCDWRELNKRHEFCTIKVANMDLRRYCDDRFEQLIKFCADNLNQVVRKKIDKELTDELYDEYESRAKSYVRGLKTIRADLKEYFEVEGDYIVDFPTTEQCEQFNNQFKSVEAILGYSGLDFVQLAKAKGLVKQLKVREFCHAMLAEFVSSD